MSHASYQAVASTRPRIRRDVLFTETPDGVLFHNSDGGFRLTARTAYRFATLIVPHLTGEYSVAEICQGMGDPQRAMVGELVKTLYERDFARSVEEVEAAAATGRAPASPDVARRFAPQIAYADHYADDAEARFLRFRDTRVAVLGTDAVARWCALSLVRNGCAVVGVLPGADTEQVEAEAAEARADGCPVEIRTLPADHAPWEWGQLAQYDFVVVTGGPAAPARLFPLLRAGIPEGRRLLPVWSYGDDAVVGPLMAHGTAGCWSCAALRMGAARDGVGAADVWSSLALAESALPTASVPGRPLAAMLGNLLGYEVFRATSGALPAETAGRLLVQDTASLDVTAEPLFPHPRCPFCAPPVEPAAEAVDLAAAGASGTPALPTLETAREADELVEELNRRSTIVRPRAGVFTGYADEELTQLPLKLGVVELGVGHAGSRAIAAFDIHHVAGARMRALDAAALVYAEHVVPARALAGPEGRGGAGEPVVVAALATASGIPGEPAAYQRAVSLLTKEPVLVPAGAVRPFGPHNADRLFERTRAGAGAGPSLADAAAAGLLSALGHAALLRAVRGAAAGVVPLPAPDGDDAELTFLVRSAERLGMASPELLDLGEGERSGAQVLLARSGERWALGEGLDRRTAAVAALRELLGAAQYEADGAGPGGPADTGDPLLRDLDARALSATGAAAPVTAGPGVSWARVLERLGDAGLDAYAVVTGAPELAEVGIHTVRVLLTAVRESGDEA
ncbi:TOMM precursor leader peptide-binding protein [Streptomyces sp. RerS4]|uniref:TOMM precursor leader peptide-binding protein n=1 Tax=Streptomyces sp. RerS4 TaxID=2942449 RepID=UPI00201C7F3D|nr:TOMM precursor leader peptide-binding protein [Streptomyces sp. RerS4]UQX04385.1 TOMM precursor leader peptide-binding protein [Streptomyces sp. RerS4]